MAGGVSQIELAKIVFEQAIELKEHMIKKTAKIMQLVDDKEINKMLQVFIVEDEQHIKMIKDKMEKLHLL